ncbi:DsbA family oxidoreductase [Micromonospora rifamycinica]|uniref:Predicted dithiol-disulfide isomerase, DsbA family n=1 Tax=Micromonospora rifamycinica TaxID=291594 RepID=A0A120FA81_9ACTN|nr:DsbA family oxidoreductase [Micromonospora rifamycinica]KWV34551.1 disulfide bond formation protein DsbA [Micromonospora rifamycinica]SCG72627.1 Predicted dithiol-disulfide isomerase, DsbA family [Micromonospora rifamycinica]
MEIEIYADVVCPWCYIGKRRLEQALASYDGEVTVRYRPFQLDPTPVTAPQPLLDALAAKFGGRERAEQMAGQVTRVAAGVGLTLNFDRAVSANTFDAHRLVRFADGHGRAGELVEALYRAHFTDGVDVGSPSALVTLATSAGLDETEVRDHLASDAGRREVAADLAAAHQLGVSSVPTFVLAGKYGVTGAQEPETLLAALTEVAQRESTP